MPPKGPITSLLVSPAIRDELKAFCTGTNQSYGEAILFLLTLIKEPGETPYDAGVRLRAQAEKARQEEKK